MDYKKALKQQNKTFNQNGNYLHFITLFREKYPPKQRKLDSPE